MSDTAPFASFGALLRFTLGDAITASAGEDFLDMCAEDILFQFPYAPIGTVTERRGKSTLAAYLSRVSSLIAFEQLQVAVTHRSTDQENSYWNFPVPDMGFKPARHTSKPIFQWCEQKIGRSFITAITGTL